jgi:hypothetical protein
MFLTETSRERRSIAYWLYPMILWMGQRNPASPTGWLKHVETLKIMGCLPPINWFRISSIHRFFNHLA